MIVEPIVHTLTCTSEFVIEEPLHNFLSVLQYLSCSCQLGFSVVSTASAGDSWLSLPVIRVYRKTDENFDTCVQYMQFFIQYLKILNHFHSVQCIQLSMEGPKRRREGFE